MAELARHGIAPDGDAAPEWVREYVNELYLFEIRRLRERQRAGLIPLSEYARHVEQLRNRYPILSLPLPYWTE